MDDNQSRLQRILKSIDHALTPKPAPGDDLEDAEGPPVPWVFHAEFSQNAPYPHNVPADHPARQSGAFDLRFGDRFVYDIDGRHGVAGEFTQDGECYVRFDDGSQETIKWNHMSPERPA